MKNRILRGIFMMTISMLSGVVMSQQEPQYTQYMYNTMSINAGYTGSRGHLVVNGLARFQWVGIDGAPNTQTFSIHGPVGYGGVALGLNIINDELGPSSRRHIEGNISYTIDTGVEGRLSFGLKLGGMLFNVDWSKGLFRDKTDPIFQENINKFFPTVGGGLYYYTSKWYVGLSVPNFISQKYYDSKNKKVTSLASDRLHYFLMGGYVFDLTQTIKFKPTFLVKAVSGAPLSLDVSANFLFNSRFTVGGSYRWDNSVSALLGFQVTRYLQIGYAYDLMTTSLRNYNSGTHEIMLKYEFLRGDRVRIKSPRFF